MCSNNVFTIIVWDFIKIARKLQKLQITCITSILLYPNEKTVKGPRLYLCTQVPCLAVEKWNCSILTERYTFVRVFL